MYLTHESSLIAHLTGAVAGATVFGTLDFIDFASADAPSIALQVAWDGYPVSNRTMDALAGSHQFSVALFVNALRIKPAERAAIAAGLEEIHRRLITWRPNPSIPDAVAEISGGQAAGVGTMWQYTINVSVPGFRVRAA